MRCESLKRWNKESSERAAQIPAAKASEHTSPYANLPSTALPRFTAKIDSDLVGALVSWTNSCFAVKTECERVQNASAGENKQTEQECDTMKLWPFLL